MPAGIAVCINTAPAQLHSGSAVYRLYPSLGNDDGQDNHVVVAVTPAASDHGLQETTVFKCDEQGLTQTWNGVDGGAEALAPDQRIVGRLDHVAALANLAGGYLIVPAKHLANIREKGENLAQHAAKTTLKLDECAQRDYALENWGFFAAHELVRCQERQEPMRSRNHVFD
jgi:hypothetical protein